MLIATKLKSADMDYTNIKVTLQCKKEYQRLQNVIKLVIFKLYVFC